MSDRRDEPVKNLPVLLIAAALVLPAGVALAQSTFTVPFSSVGGSSASGSAVLTAAGNGTVVSLDITGLASGAPASAALHAGTCDAPSASFAALPGLTADASGRATASGQVLFRGTDPVALSTLADGGHVILINQSGQAVACAWIPQVENSPVGMPRTGGPDALLRASILILGSTLLLAGGLAMRRQH
jgi:hypothetical protein